MRQIEAAAQRVAQLVVQPHGHAAQHGAAEPGAVQRVAARGQVVRVGLQRRQRGGAGANAFFGHQRHHRVAVVRVQAFSRVGDGIERARHGHGIGQRERELGVVDHRARHHTQVAPCPLDAAFGDAVDRRHLAAGVGGGDGDDGQPAVQRDGLAQPRGAAAADRHGAVGAQPLRLGARLAGGFQRHVHGGPGKQAGAAVAQQRQHLLGRRGLFGRAQHQRAARAQAFDLGAHLLQAAGAEDHACRIGLEGEGVHEPVCSNAAVCREALRRRTVFRWRMPGPAPRCGITRCRCGRSSG